MRLSKVVRQSAVAPGGRADLLFSIPEKVGFSNQGIHVYKDSIRIVESVLAIQHCPIWKNRDIHDLLHCYVNIHGLVSPISPKGGIDQYLKLISYPTEFSCKGMSVFINYVEKVFHI